MRMMSKHASSKQSSQSSRNSTSSRPASAPVRAGAGAGTKAKAKVACQWCSGSGKQQAFPELDLTLVNQRRLAEGAGVSESLVCRMLSDNPKVRRANPTLKTLKGLQSYIEAERGVRVPLDMIAELITC